MDTNGKLFFEKGHIQKRNDKQQWQEDWRCTQPDPIVPWIQEGVSV